jgi:PAS domain S-box-containing protein
MKIKEKIQIRFIGIAFVLAASLISIVYFSMVSHFEHQEGEKLKDNVFQSAKSIDDFMFARVNDLNVLSNNPLFSTSSNITISNYLSRLVEQYPYYDNITFANTEAHILASSSNDLVGLNIIDIEPDIEEEFYKTLKGGDEDVYISDIAEVSQKEINENSPLDVELLSNVIDLDGNVIGVLVGFVNVQFIKDVTYDIDNRTIGNEYAYLVNSNGDVVISANPETVILQPHPDLSLKELKQKLKNEENGYIIYTNSKGKKVITGFADLSEYGTDNIGNWSLISTAPYDEIMIPIYQMLYKELIAFIFILVFIVLLTINLSSSLSKPLTKLQKAVAKFDINKKPLELKIETKDEVEDLSKSFNLMSKNIYDSSQERKQIANLLNESKDQLDNILNNIGDPVFVKDDQSRLLIVNDAFCNMFYLSKSEILGLTLAEHVPADERESFLKIDKQVLEDGIQNINEENLTIKGHETRIISTKKTRYVDNNGNKFLIGVIRDITNQKKTEKKILEIQQKLKAAIRIGKIGYWSWDIINDKVEWSDLMYEIYDVDKNTTLKYDTVLSCIHPDDREFHNQLVEKRIKNKDNSPIEYRLLCKDETIKYVMVQMEVVDDDQGEAIVFQGTVIDITERKKAETALIESELKYRTLFTTMSEGFIIGELLYDDNGDPCDYVVIETNFAYETQTGIKAQYVVGKKIRDVLPDIDPVWIKTVGNVVKTGKSIRFEDYDIRTQKYYEAFMYKLKDNHFGILFLDITNRKKAEIKLKISEEKFSNAFYSSPAGLTINRINDGKFIEVNDAFLKMFEFKREEIIGNISTDLNIISPEARAELFKKQRQEGGFQSTELLLYSKTGKPINLFFSSRPITINNDACHVATMIDITDRKLAEKNLVESESNLRQSQIVANIGSYNFNFKDNTWKSSDVLDQILGINETFVKDFDSFMNLIHPSDRELVQNSFDKNVKNNEKFNQEYRIINQISNNEIWVNTIGELELDRDGNPLHMVGTTQDITQRKLAEIELEKYRNQLEGLVEKRTHQLEKEKIKAQSADLMKSAFLATMSHELRAPMNSIIGFAGILLKELAGPLNDEQKKQLAMVKKSGEHLLGLINDILDISKIEAGKLKVSLKPFNYVNSLKNTINFLLPQAEAKGLNMVLKINENDITLISDERRVEQILVNLLSNAIKFSKKGTITVKVDVMNNLINTQIIDVGIGISEENLVKLFKPFMQLEEGLSRSHEGTGLGLAICKNLIEKLGGSIDVKSQLGKGSIFTFTLPLQNE